MFNGIIFNQGIITRILKVNKGIYLFLKSNLKVNNKNIGISISCDGVCLTVISVKNKVLKFYLSNETIERSKFNKSKLGDKINLELPLKYGQKISGHICQGHIDSVAKINKIKKQGKSYIFEFNIDKNYRKYLIEKASVLINGVSLTISKITKYGFQVSIIPHTIKLTNLSQVKKGDLVNIEVDILSKYIRKYFYGKN